MYSSGNMGASATITCALAGGVKGRWVIVQLRTTNFMHICEVEIQGYPAKTPPANIVTNPANTVTRK